MRVACAPGDETIGTHQHATVRLDSVEIAEVSGRILQTIAAGAPNVQCDVLLPCREWGAAAPFLRVGSGKQHEVAVVKIER